MLKFVSKLLRYFEHWEYYDPLSFWSCMMGGFVSVTIFLNPLFNSSLSRNSSQSGVLIEQIRGGSQQQHELINGIDNLAKKNI